MQKPDVKKQTRVVIAKVIGIIVTVFLFWLLWNWTIPNVTNLNSISIIESFGVLALLYTTKLLNSILDWNGA